MLQEEEKLLKQGEEWRMQGKRVPLEPEWLENGDQQFIKDLIEGKYDRIDKGNYKHEDLSETLKKMKLVEDSNLEEQGNRLVNSKAKSPSLSPKKMIDNKFNGSPINKFNLSNANNGYNASPTKNVKLKGNLF